MVHVTLMLPGLPYDIPRNSLLSTQHTVSNTPIIMPTCPPAVWSPHQADLKAAVTAAEAERDAQLAQVRKLLGDAARLHEQLTSATEDIFTLQVCRAWGDATSICHRKKQPRGWLMAHLCACLSGDPNTCCISK